MSFPLESYDAHTVMSTQALNVQMVLRGILRCC